MTDQPVEPTPDDGLAYNIMESLTPELRAKFNTLLDQVDADQV